METKKCQVLVIGAGPGGYVAAIRAGQLGLKTIIVEGEKAGGACLIRGCIPSKALIHAAHRFHDLAKHAAKDGHMGISIPGPAELNMAELVGWKENIVTRLNKGVEHLLKNAGAELITGWAEFQDAKTVKIGKGKDAIIVQADHVILANGSVPIELPFMPYDEHVISSREALSLETLPEHVAIVGGGYIGLELGITFRMLGSEVTVVEAMDSVLPIFDKELRRPLEIAIKKQKIKTHLGVFAKGTEATKDGRVQLNFIDKNEKDEKKMQHVVVDKVLVTVGRKPNSASLAPTGVALDERGFVKVNDRCETNMKGVYAIGDVCDSGEMLATLHPSKERWLLKSLLARSALMTLWPFLPSSSPNLKLSLWDYHLKKQKQLAIQSSSASSHLVQTVEPSHKKQRNLQGSFGFALVRMTTES